MVFVATLPGAVVVALGPLVRREGVSDA
jgi:hypothetical protein